MGSPQLDISAKARLSLELTALYLCFVPHENNSNLRKWTTIIAFLTWGIASLMLFSGNGVEIWVYMPLTAVVFYILGRQHNLEFHRLIRP